MDERRDAVTTTTTTRDDDDDVTGVVVIARVATIARAFVSPRVVDRLASRASTWYCERAETYGLLGRSVLTECPNAYIVCTNSRAYTSVSSSYDARRAM